jgi:uncharacterized protein (DUF3820 family)
MSDIHTTVYIDSGRKNAMYTLRQTRCGGMHHIDMYLRNLSNDREKAEAKAREWFDRVYGNRDQQFYHFEGFADFDLNEWGGPDPWERAALRMIEEGLIPFGQHKDEKIADQDDGYVLWWAKQTGDTEPGEKLVEAMKALAEERGLFEKEREEAKRREAERERTQATADVPVTQERIEITGEVVGIKWVEGYGYYSPDVKKIIVLDDRGFKLYGSAPSKLDAERGDRITFMAAIEPSKDDTQFGFFKRPTKPKMLQEAE